MIRIALCATLLLAACKHAPPAEPPGPGAGDPAACEPLDAAGCAANAACAPITALPEDAAGSCTLAQEVVGCHAADTACGDAITYATDADGNGWWFMDTCVPAGFTTGADPDGAFEPPPGC